MIFKFSHVKNYLDPVRSLKSHWTASYGARPSDGIPGWSKFILLASGEKGRAEMVPEDTV